MVSGDENIKRSRSEFYHSENRESAKLFVSSKILSGLGSVASQEIGELVNTWVQRPGQAWSVIFRASEHGYQVSTRVTTPVIIT